MFGLDNIKSCPNPPYEIWCDKPTLQVKRFEFFRFTDDKETKNNRNEKVPEEVCPPADERILGVCGVLRHGPKARQSKPQVKTLKCFGFSVVSSR